VQEEAVDLIGKDELLHRDVTGAEGVGQGGGLGVGYVGVVVAVDKKNGRRPVGQVGEWGAGKSFGSEGVLLGVGTALPVAGVIFEVPVVNAVEVDAGGEEVGVAGEGEGGEIASVTASPDADAGGVDVRARAKILCGGQDIVVLFAAIGAGVNALAEVDAISDAAAVVDRKDDEAARAEVLVHGVGVGVVVHRGIAEQHLAVGAAVDEQDGGAFPAGACGWEEDLAV
jgi:hypothetical protein